MKSIKIIIAVSTLINEQVSAANSAALQPFSKLIHSAECDVVDTKPYLCWGNPTGDAFPGQDVKFNRFMQSYEQTCKNTDVDCHK